MCSVFKQFYGKKGGAEDCYGVCKTKLPGFTQALVKLHSILTFSSATIIIAWCHIDRCLRD